VRWAVIGVGNMGEALARGLVLRGAAVADSVVVVDPRADVVDRLVDELGVRAGAIDQARAADVIVLAVKPQVMVQILSDLAPHVRTTEPRPIVVSVAAGVRLATLEAALPEGTPVVRTMPNTPCLVGAGASAWAPGTHADARAGAVTRALLEAVGLAIEVAEADLDAVTALSGSGPAYVFALIEAMVEGGIAAGLAPEVAAILARQTVLGAARLAVESGVEPAELRRRVTSPGGTTAAALGVLEAGRWRESMVLAIVAARDRGRELGR